MKAALFGPSFSGGMAERLKAAVLKTAKGSQPFVGSNPTSSVAVRSLSGRRFGEMAERLKAQVC